MRITKKTYLYPLLCWDVAFGFKPFFWGPDKDVDGLNALHDEKAWKNNINYREMLSRYKAIIVTSPNQVIEWVSSGFQKMTGYAPIEVIGKSPSFLQGKDRDETHDRVEIRKAITEVKPVQAKLLNYRKNGDPYICELDIHPVYNDKDELVNFIAFENEAKSLSPLKHFVHRPN